MSLLKLPPELIDIILDIIRDEKQTLSSVSLTCYGLHNLAIPHLYSNVSISQNPEAIQLFHFARTMLDNSHLASFVKFFSEPFYPSLDWPQIGERFEPLKGWLQNIINLKILHLFIFHDPRKIPFPTCPFHLETLTVNSRYGGLTLPAIEGFLEDQSELVSINVADAGLIKPMYQILSPLACPKLKMLSGEIYDAKILFRGRRVVHFEWFYYRQWNFGPTPPHDPASLLPILSDQLNNLHSLSFRTDFHYGPPTSYLRSLRFLETEKLHPEDWVSIPTLPHLRVLLVLEPADYNDISILDEPDRVVKLFLKCPTLRRVDVGGRDHGTSLTCYRWLRGVEKSIIIPLHVAEQGRKEFLSDEEEDI